MKDTGLKSIKSTGKLINVRKGTSCNQSSCQLSKHIQQLTHTHTEKSFTFLAKTLNLGHELLFKINNTPHTNTHSHLHMLWSPSLMGFRAKKMGNNGVSVIGIGFSN